MCLHSSKIGLSWLIIGLKLLTVLWLESADRNLVCCCKSSSAGKFSGMSGSLNACGL